MRAYRSAHAELEGDDAVADLLHAEAGLAPARRALARAEVRAGAVETEHEPVAHRADRVVPRVDQVTAITHGRRSPPPRARARTRSRGALRRSAVVRRAP